MRELGNEDIYLISEIMDKMDMRYPDKPKLKAGEEKLQEKAMEEYGLKLIKTFMRNIHKAKPEINLLLSSLTEKSIEEVKAMSGSETINLILSIFGKDGFADFFI